MDLIITQNCLDELSDKLREKFPELTDDDLKHKEGMGKGMLRMVAYKLRKTKQEMREIIAGL